MYLQKKSKQDYLQKRKQLKIPTLFLFLLFFPYPSFPPWSFSPLSTFDISYKIFKEYI